MLEYINIIGQRDREERITNQKVAALIAVLKYLRAITFSQIFPPWLMHSDTIFTARAYARAVLGVVKGQGS